MSNDSRPVPGSPEEDSSGRPPKKKSDVWKPDETADMGRLRLFGAIWMLAGAVIGVVSGLAMGQSGVSESSRIGGSLLGLVVAFGVAFIGLTRLLPAISAVRGRFDAWEESGHGSRCNAVGALLALLCGGVPYLVALLCV